MSHDGQLVELFEFGAFGLLAMFGAAALVELFEHTDRAVGLDHRQATAFDLDREPMGLFSKQPLLGIEDHFVALGLD